MDFLTIVTLGVAAQLVPIMNESLGGVTGQDSIWRAVAAQMDHSLGGLYLAGLFSIVFPSSSIIVRRTGLLHTPRETSVESIEVTLRSKWLNLASQERRRGQLFMPPSDTPLDFSPNFSMFIIPYMLDCSPSPDQSVRLTRARLRATAARSVARFAIFLASISIIFTIRASIISRYMENGVQKYLMLGSEIGRYFMIVLQESSILTYSCGFKCVATWAYPYTYSKWDVQDQEEERFRSDVVESMGYAYHAYALFWLIELAWKGMARLLPWWKRKLGPRIFSKFSIPSNSEFQGEEMVTIRLRVEEPLEFSGNWHQKFVVEFEMPKTFDVARTERLRGKIWFRWGALCLCTGFAICGVVGPINVIGDGQTSSGAKFLFAIMQLVPWALFYKDIPNQSINCVFASPSSAHSDPITDAISIGSHSEAVASGRATTVSTVARRPPIASSSNPSSSSQACPMVPIRRDPPKEERPSIESCDITES